MNFWTDSREKPQVRSVVAFAVGSAQVMKLEAGDFLIIDKCGHSAGFERKTVSDLLGSLATKNSAGEARLINQLRRMLSTYDWCVLVWEVNGLGYNVVDRSVIAGKRNSGWRSGPIQAYLVKIQTELGVTLLPQADLNMTADTLRMFVEKARRGCVLPKAMKVEDLEAA